LSQARTQLREVDRLLGRLPNASPEVARTTERELREARAHLAQSTSRCFALPTYPGENAYQARIAARSAEMNDSIDRLQRRLESGDRPGAFEELARRTEPAVDRVDQAMRENIQLNARESADLGAEIASIRASTNTLRAFLNALSATLAIAAAFMMVRVLRRFTGLMEARVSDMEHFAGRVAHDVRSPLASVGLALELTKRDPEASIRRGILDRANRTLQNVTQLVDGLLVFARAGAPPPEHAATNVGEVLDGVIDELRPFADQSGIALALESPATSAVVACSPGVLISLASNLIGNSIKYMGASPVRRVHVRARDVGKAIRFEVRDTGPGVPPELRERIFDPYVRAAESTVPGLGLGLATVRRLVEAHGGSVGVLPNDDLGSLFWFELPKAEVRPARALRHIRRRWVPRPS
jgi:signal transduction histidine kinase